MRDFLERHRTWVIVLAVLALGNLIFHWPHQVVARPDGFPGGPPPMGADGAAPPAPTPEMQARMEARLKKMTPERRAKFEARRQAEQAFFDSVRDLPETERKQKLQEHFTAHRPGGPDGEDDDGPGGPDGGGTMHIPSVDTRRAMDQQIVNNPGGGR
jgi:hypothetical protein